MNCEVCFYLLRADPATQETASLLIDDDESDRQMLLWVLLVGRGFQGDPSDIRFHLSGHEPE